MWFGQGLNGQYLGRLLSSAWILPTWKTFWSISPIHTVEIFYNFNITLGSGCILHRRKLFEFEQVRFFLFTFIFTKNALQNNYGPGPMRWNWKNLNITYSDLMTANILQILLLFGKKGCFVIVFSHNFHLPAVFYSFIHIMVFSAFSIQIQSYSKEIS